jgi:hypothetical protein
MNKKMKILFSVASLVAIALPVASQAGFFGPSSFDECVVAETKEFTGPVPRGALSAIWRICRERFPEPIKPAPADAEACANIADGQDTGWSSIITSTKFRFMTDNQREEARIRFFLDRIIPKVKSIEKLPEYRAAWDAKTYPARYVRCD